MRFTVRRKIGLIFLVFCCGMLMLGCIGLYALTDANEKTAEIVKTWSPGVAVSGRLNALIMEYRLETLYHIAMIDPRDIAKHEGAAKELAQKINENFAAYEDLVANGLYASAAQRQEDRAQIGAVKAVWQQYLTQAERAMALSRRNEPAAALRLFRQDCAPLAVQSQAKINEIFAFNQDGAAELGRAVTAACNRSRLLFAIVILAALLLGGGIVIAVGHRLASATEKLLAAFQEIARGNLRGRIAAQTQDEMGDLARAANQMTAQMQDLIAQIQRTAEQTAAASEELTASADQSAQVTQSVAQSVAGVSALSSEQAAAVDAAAHGVERMSSGIEATSAAVGKTARHAKDAVCLADAGNQTIENAVGQMRDIEQTVDQSAAVVTKLGKRSQEIGQIVDTISGIAGQTNLLALNAAIEAARAGEMGKGFAVVAEEVRKLAEQSQDAAKQIADLIATIQRDTEQAVAAMGKGTQKVRAGAGAVNEAGTAFTKILAVVNEVNSQAADSAHRLEEMANETQRIVDAVRSVDQSGKHVADEAQSVSAATQEQSAAMEEIASASRSLADLAQKLQAAAGKFEL